MLHRETQEKIASQMRAIVEAENLELVEYKIFSSRGSWTVRCLIDYPQGGVTIDECARLNKAIFNYLEKENVLGENFIVEVNSPGLDRPLRNYSDFLKAKGREVGVWFKEYFLGKNYLEGEVVEVTNDNVTIKVKQEYVLIPLSVVRVAKQKIEKP